MKVALFALAALVPFMAGTAPAPASGAEGIVVPLCNGGFTTIPLDGEEDQAPPMPCHPMGCHAEPCRKKFDPTQGLRPPLPQ